MNDIGGLQQEAIECLKSVNYDAHQLLLKMVMTTRMLNQAVPIMGETAHPTDQGSKKDRETNLVKKDWMPPTGSLK
jgi:hypothetical protein